MGGCFLPKSLGREPTLYNFGSARTSSFWLVNRSGHLVASGLYEDLEQIKELLAGLE